MDLYNKIHTSIIRLFIGEASPEEKKSIGDWLSQSPENQKFYNDLKEIWLQSGVANNSDQYGLEKAIVRFRNRINKSKKLESRQKFIRNTLKYAAIILLLISLPISFFVGKGWVEFPDSYTTITCALGDKTEMILPDNSKVWLNSGSKLRFNNNFKKGERQVFLEGEAFFSVEKDKNNPFVVKANEINIEVLGTEFNLKAYSEEGKVSATLIEGSIKMASPYNKTKIEPGQKVVYNRKTQQMALTQMADILQETEWKEGRLVFRNESLAEMELKLERWFDVDIVFADDAVKQRKFTGILERESILEVVSYFGLSRYVNYKIEGNKITFFSKNSN